MMRNIHLTKGIKRKPASDRSRRKNKGCTKIDWQEKCLRNNQPLSNQALRMNKYIIQYIAFSCKLYYVQPINILLV